MWHSWQHCVNVKPGGRERVCGSLRVGVLARVCEEELESVCAVACVSRLEKDGDSRNSGMSKNLGGE